jgi:hypothetical protein
MTISAVLLKAFLVYLWTSMGLITTISPQETFSLTTTLLASTGYTPTTVSPHDVTTPTLSGSSASTLSANLPSKTPLEHQTSAIFPSHSESAGFNRTVMDEPNSTWSFTNSFSSNFSSIQNVDTTHEALSSGHIIPSTALLNLSNHDLVSNWLSSGFKLDDTTLFESESTQVFPESLSNSAEPESESKNPSIQDWSSHIQSTSAEHFQTTSVTRSDTGISPSPTSSIMTSSIPETPNQKPSTSATSQDKFNAGFVEDLSSGSKIAIAVIVAACVLGVIVAGVIVYQRYNITHRSFKSFLTSGIRYKTYNNAIYKDDEGLLIILD